MPASSCAIAIGLFLGLGGACLACVSDTDAQKLTTEANDSPEVFAILDPMAISQPTGLSLIVCGGNVSGIVVDAWMPAHQHGMNYEPEIESLGEGQYAVSNMVYHMPGLWQLKVTLETGDDRPVYVLDMPIR